ncbi:hypothetical protein CPB86DRAFT_813029 [Serendipita vermifera]|nr:hypothetical protein CPB86DRAFT_813029 [Serendipita vermifera]
MQTTPQRHGKRKREESPPLSPIGPSLDSPGQDMHDYIPLSQTLSTSGTSHAATISGSSRQQSVSSSTNFPAYYTRDLRRTFELRVPRIEDVMERFKRRKREDSSPPHRHAPSFAFPPPRLTGGVGQVQDRYAFPMRREYEFSGVDSASAIPITSPVPDWVEGSRALPIVVEDDDDLMDTVGTSLHGGEWIDEHNRGRDEEPISPLSDWAEASSILPVPVGKVEENVDVNVADSQVEETVEDDGMILDELEEEEHDEINRGSDPLVLDWFPTPPGALPILVLPPNVVLRETVETEETSEDVQDDDEWFPFGPGVPYLFNQPGYIQSDEDSEDEDSDT